MKKMAAIVMAALLLAPALASAEQKGGVKLTSLAEVEVVQQNAAGEKLVKRVDAEKAHVVPGDTVIYTIGYFYQGEKPATDVAVNNPIPEHLVYVDKSAEGAGTRIDFSIDHGKSYAPAGKLKVRSADGKERPATAEEITNIRWTLEKALADGAKGTVSFRAKVQ